MRLFKYILLTTIVFFVLVIYFMLTEKLTFGWGLGDLLFFYLQALWLFILVIVLIVILTKKNATINIIISGLLSLLLITSMVLSIKAFTVDRGSDYPWNNRIFRISHDEWIQIKEIKYKNKMDSLDKIIINHPTDFKTITVKGLMLNEKENWDLAIIEFKKALQINPNYFKALYNLGFDYCSIGDFDNALIELEKAKLIDSTNADVNNRIKNIKADKK